MGVGVQACVCVCGGLRLRLEIMLNGSSTSFTESLSTRLSLSTQLFPPHTTQGSLSPHTGGLLHSPSIYVGAGV